MQEGQNPNKTQPTPGTPPETSKSAKDRLANQAAVWGVLCWTCLPIVGSILAVYYGRKALKAFSGQSNHTGRKKALFGMWSGCASCGIILLAFIGPLIDPAGFAEIEAKKKREFSVGLLGPSGKVVDGVAITEKTVNYHSTKKLEGYEAAQAIYEIAKSRPEVTSVKIVFYMNPSGLEDKYGNAIKDPLLMGEIVETQLDEVRRYRDAEAYAYNAQYGYSASISRMSYAFHLK